MKKKLIRLLINKTTMNTIKVIKDFINTLIQVDNMEKSSYIDEYVQTPEVNVTTKEDLITYLSDSDYLCCNLKFISYNMNKFIGVKTLPGYSSKKDKHLTELVKFINANETVKKSEKKLIKKTNKKLDKNTTIDYIKKYKQHSSNARQRGILNYLSFDDYVLLCKFSCYMCDDDEAGGVDRTESDEQYTINNSEPCCAMCNSIKSSFPDKEFMAKIRKIVKFHEKQ